MQLHNWYKIANQSEDFFTANLTEDQSIKKDILRDYLKIWTIPILKRLRQQNECSLGDAVDVAYNRIENNLSPISCEKCKWLIDKKCNNTNWTGPNHNIENAPCDGISWEKSLETV